MRRHLREAAKDSDDRLPGNECLGVMIRRWEKGEGGISERYRMHYCKAFGVPFDEFGSAPIVPAPVTSETELSPVTQAADLPVTAQAAETPEVPSAIPDETANDRSVTSAGPRDPGDRLPVTGGPTLAHEVELTAHQGNEHAQLAERRDIGEASLEHLRSEVVRLSRECLTAEPLPLFFEMRRVREQMYQALDRKIWPRDEVEVYFLLGCLSSLMADMAESIGNPSAAEELARSGLAYALAIDHRPLIAQLRLNLAVVALWTGQSRRGLDLAASGLSYLATGPNGAQLHIMHARAAARLGDTDTAMAKISLAAQVRDTDYADDLLQIGGQFSFSLACHHYLAGFAAADLASADSEAISQLRRAVELYEAGPGPGEDHSEHCKMIARVDLASAWLKAGDLDAALTTVGPVLVLPPGRRISKLPKRLTRMRRELAGPGYRGAPEAKDLDEQIERYCRDDITTHLSQAAGPR